MRHAVRLVASLAPLVACACSGRDPVLPTVDAGPEAPLLSCTQVGGTRLAVRTLVAGDASQPAGMFDRERETGCRPEVLGDSVRCLPDPVTRAGDIIFTDAACAVRVVALSAEDAAVPPAYLRQDLQADACTTTPTFSRIGDPAEIAEGATIYRLDEGTCTMTTAAAGQYFELGEQLGVESFVELEPGVLPEGRVSVRSYVGPDGSIACGSTLFDGDLDTTCAFTAAADGGSRCLPRGLPSVQAAYGDAGCADAVDVTRYDADCGTPRPAFARRTDGATCVARTVVELAGEPLDPQAAYTGAPGSCSAIALQSGEVFLPVGAEVSAFSFVGRTIEEAPSAGRLRRLDAVVEGGGRIPADGYFDAELDTWCTISRATDDTLRCVPTTTGTEGRIASLAARYTDAACTVAVDVGVLPRACEAVTPRFARLSATRSRAAPVTGTHPGPLYTKSGDACVAVAAESLYYALGTELAPDDLVEAAYAVE